MALLAKDKNIEHNQERLPYIYLKTLQEEPDYARSCKQSVKVVMREKKKFKVFVHTFQVFTTAGPPKICTDQYNKPIGLYSAETVWDCVSVFWTNHRRL